MLAMKVALSDDRGLLEQAAGRNVEGEPDELGVRPIQGVAEKVGVPDAKPGWPAGGWLSQTCSGSR
jgi:hypothetical protein